MDIECYDKEGTEAYDLVLRQVIMDLQLGPAIIDSRIFIDPRDPLFIIALKISKAARPVYIDEVAEYHFNKEKTQIKIKINNENYLPNILEKLRFNEGRDNVQQPSRYELIIDNPKTDFDNFIIHNPEESVKKKTYDAISRILPEGFRVVKDISDGYIIAMVATDELLKDEWIQQGISYVEELKT